MVAALIGNSHVIAVETALRRAKASRLDVRRSCFSSDFLTVDEIEDGDRLRLRVFVDEPGEKKWPDIYIDDCDHVIISAIGWWAPRNLTVDDYDPPIHPLAYMACAGWGYAPDCVPANIRLTSTAVFRATVEAWVREQPLTQILQRLAAVYQNRIFLQPWPAPNRMLKTDVEWFPNRWYGKRGPRVWFDFFTAQLHALRAIAAECGPKVTLLDYPLAEIYEDGFMDGALCDSDPFHANEKYGALVVKQISSMI